MGVARADILTVNEPQRRIRLFGDFQVWAAGHRIDQAASPRVCLLVAALSLERGQPIDRARLAFQLWPDSTDGQARTNLRKVLHELRAWLPGDSWLEADQRRARIRTESVQIDVEAFLSALERGTDETAMEHYRGPLLPGHWEDWIVEERRALERLAVDCLRRQLEAGVEPARQRDIARRLLDLDPVDEAAHRALMLATAAGGNRGAALRAFHACTAVLDRQLGVPPGPETIAVYESIRSPAGSSAEATSQPRTPLGRAGSLALVGRDRDLDWLEKRWHAALADGRRGALIIGESGIGKTRLIEELCHRHERRRITVLRSRAYESDGGSSLVPIVDWLRHDPVDHAVEELPIRQRTELSRLLPEHAAATLPPSSGDPNRTRVALFDAVAAALAAAGSPLLLALDDLQWCDQDTVDFVIHLLHRGPVEQALVVMTRRSHERPLDDALGAKLADLQSDGVLDERRLGRLQPVSTAAIARLASDADWSDNALAQLHVETDGLPLFVVEAARTGPAGDHLTPTVKGTIERRLTQLDPGQRLLLEVASIIGRRFEPIELANAARIGEDDVIDAIDELWRLGLLVSVGSEFDFGHDQFREVVAAAVSPARRRRVHRDVAEMLVALRGPEIDPIADRLSEHYELAGLPEEAIDARRSAAARASTIGAHPLAIQHVSQALQLLTEQPAGIERDRCELALVTDLGIAQAVHSGYGSLEAQATWARAEALNVRLGTTLSAPVLRGLAMAAVASCRLDRAATYCETLCLSSDPIAEVEGHYAFGVTRFWQGRFDEAEQHLRQAIEGYDPANSPEHRSLYGQDPKAVCLARLAHLLVLRGRAVEADGFLERAETLADQLDDSLTAWYVWHWRVNIDRYLGRATVSEPPEGPSHGFFATSDREAPLWEAALAGNREAERSLEQIAEAWRDDGRCLELTKWLAVLAGLRLQAGEGAPALRYLDEAEAFARERGQLYWTPELGRLRAMALRMQGDRRCVEAAAGAVATAEAMGAAGMALRAEAELLRCTDQSTVADRLRHRLAELRPVHHGWDVDDAAAALDALADESAGEGARGRAPG